MLGRELSLSLLIVIGPVLSHAEGSKAPNKGDSAYWQQVWAAQKTPPKPVDWASAGNAIKAKFFQMFDRESRYVDHAIPAQDVANPVWNVKVHSGDTECAFSRGSTGNTIMVKENGKERFALSHSTSDLSAKAYLYCGQALLRAGGQPADIPLVQFVNDVKARTDLKQSVDVDPGHVEITENPFGGNSMILVDGRYPASYLSPVAVADARRQIEAAHATGKMLTINFNHPLTQSGLSPSDQKLPESQTASADILNRPADDIPSAR